MASGPLFAVLATRALDASKAARAAERHAPRARETQALRGQSRSRASARSVAPGPPSPAALRTPDRGTHALGAGPTVLVATLTRPEGERASAAADRADPPLGDRRRRGARRSVRTAPPRVRGPHGLRALAVLHRGLHPRTASCRCTGTRTPRRRRRAGTPRRCARTPAGSSTRRSTAATEDVVVFCGSGATGAIDKLVRLLDLAGPCAERPVVFLGPYEHHSNELPWRESRADVVTIREDADGRIDVAHLEAELRPARGIER